MSNDNFLKYFTSIINSMKYTYAYEKHVLKCEMSYTFEVYYFSLSFFFLLRKVRDIYFQLCCVNNSARYLQNQKYHKAVAPTPHE